MLKGQLFLATNKAIPDYVWLWSPSLDETSEAFLSKVARDYYWLPCDYEIILVQQLADKDLHAVRDLFQEQMKGKHIRGGWFACSAEVAKSTITAILADEKGITEYKQKVIAEELESDAKRKAYSIKREAELALMQRTYEVECADIRRKYAQKLDALKKITSNEDEKREAKAGWGILAAFSEAEPYSKEYQSASRDQHILLGAMQDELGFAFWAHQRRLIAGGYIYQSYYCRHRDSYKGFVDEHGNLVVVVNSKWEKHFTDAQPILGQPITPPTDANELLDLQRERTKGDHDLRHRLQMY